MGIFSNSVYNMGQTKPMDMRPKEDRLMEQLKHHIECSYCDVWSCDGPNEPHKECHRCQALAIFEELNK